MTKKERLTNLCQQIDEELLKHSKVQGTIRNTLRELWRIIEEKDEVEIPSHNTKDWEEFVGFIRPFKNRDYTDETANEIIKRVKSLLKSETERVRELVLNEIRKTADKYAHPFLPDDLIYSVLRSLEDRIQEMLTPPQER